MTTYKFGPWKQIRGELEDPPAPPPPQKKKKRVWGNSESNFFFCVCVQSEWRLSRNFDFHEELYWVWSVRNGRTFSKISEFEGLWKISG